jgi:hypothetical protein
MVKRPDEVADPLAGDWLWQAAEIREQPFVSQAPVIGRLVAGCRTAWGWIADRAYVRPLGRRQSELNRALLRQMADLDHWLLLHDRETVAQSRDVARLVWRLHHLTRRLRRIENAMDEATQNQGSG